MTIIAVNLKVRLHGGQPLSDDFERSFSARSASHPRVEGRAARRVRPFPSLGRR